MTKRSNTYMPVLGALVAALAISGNLLSGFLVGLLAPVAAIAGMVAAIRLATGKVPFLGHIWESEDGERHLSIKLVTPDEAQALYTEHKERLSDELGPMKDEIKAAIEATKASAEGEVIEEGPEVAAEE